MLGGIIVSCRDRVGDGDGDGEAGFVEEEETTRREEAKTIGKFT